MYKKMGLWCEGVIYLGVVPFKRLAWVGTIIPTESIGGPEDFTGGSLKIKNSIGDSKNVEVRYPPRYLLNGKPLNRFTINKVFKSIIYKCTLSILGYTRPVLDYYLFINILKSHWNFSFHLIAQTHMKTMSKCKISWWIGLFVCQFLFLLFIMFPNLAVIWCCVIGG